MKEEILSSYKEMDKCDLGEASDMFFLPDLLQACFYYILLTYVLVFYSHLILRDIKIKLHVLGLIFVLRPSLMFATQITQNEKLKSNDLVILFITEGMLEMVFYYLLFKIKIIQVMIEHCSASDEIGNPPERFSFLTSPKTLPSQYTKPIEALQRRLSISFLIYSLTILSVFILRLFMPRICSPQQNLVLLCVYIPLQFVTVGIGYGMIWFFQSTSSKFIMILKREDDTINVTMTKIVFGIVALVKAIG